MKKLLLLLTLSSVPASGNDIAFDPADPPLLRPGLVYAFPIKPTPESKPFTIRLHAENETSAKDQAGEFYAAIKKLTATSPDGKTSELPFDQTDIGVHHTYIGDFDFDGDLDFRISVAWGTGGTWYAFYRFRQGRYEHWEEPEELGINAFDVKAKEAVASARSGPEHASTYFKYKNGHFSKVRMKAVLAKDSLPEFKDKDVAWVFAEVTEIWEAGKLIKRTVEPEHESP